MECITEALLRMGIFTIGRYSGSFNVKSLMNGSANADLHYATISKICQLILTKQHTAGKFIIMRIARCNESKEEKCP